jgi:hypothetical integral membrane protein (TIGR02206 family)
VTGAAPFTRFGSAHVVAVASVAVIAAALVWRVRQAGPGSFSAVRAGLALSLLASQLAEQLSAHAEGRSSLQVALPLHLCDLSWVLALAGLARPGRRLAEPLYFFALSGTAPALVTPELPWGFPSTRFLAYFATHGLVVITAVVLTFGFRLVPPRGAAWRAFGLLNLYALLVTPVNLALDTNYLYLRRKPDPWTPFDLMGPWPYYILALEAAFLAVFVLLDRGLDPLREREGRDHGQGATPADGEGEIDPSAGATRGAL